MKKLFFIFCLFFSLASIGQTSFPINTTTGTNSTTVLTRGISAADSAYWHRTDFVDTTTANLGRIDEVGGRTIRTGNIIWLRSSDATRWIDISNGQTAGDLVPFYGCVKGCTVTWLQNYDYEVAESVYYILGTRYESEKDTVTLAAAHATLNRIDVFVLNTSSAGAAVTGTPSVTPEQPDVDVATQLQISFALVNANTTEPTITNEWIYREDLGQPTEWDFTTAAGSVNLASTNFPYAGTKDIEGTNVPNGVTIQAGVPTTPTYGNYDALVFKIRSKGNWGNNRSISVNFRSSMVNKRSQSAIITTGQYGFNSATTGAYQNITIPLSVFGDLAQCNYIVFTTAYSGGGTIGFYIDDIQLTNINGQDDGNVSQFTLDERWISDWRRNNWGTANILGLTYQDENRQSVTLSGSGSNNIHGLTAVKDKLFAVTRANFPMGIIRFNNLNDLTDYQILPITQNDYDGGYDIVYVPFKNKLYATVSTEAAVMVAEIDPVTFTYTIVVNQALAFHSPISLAFDNQYLYVLTSNGVSGQGRILKANMATWVVSSTTLTTVGAVPHAIGYDGTNLYVTEQASPGKIYKINPSTMTVTASATFASGDNNPTDDISFSGDYVWIGLETSSGYILKIAKSDLSITRVNTGTASQSYGTYFDGKYIWNMHNSTPGVLSRINPETLEIYKMSLLTGENSPNEMVIADGQRYFISCYLNPSKVIRFATPALTYVSSQLTASITADNGLTANTATNVRLGGTALVANTAILTSVFSLTIPSSNATGSLIATNSGSGVAGQFSSTNGDAVYGTSTNAAGVTGIAQGSGSGMVAQSSTGFIIEGFTSASAGAIFQVNPASTNTIIPVLQLSRSSSGTAANNIGGSIEFYTETSSGQPLSNSLVSRFTIVDNATRTSQFIIRGINNAITADKLVIEGDGRIYGTGLHNAAGAVTGTTNQYIASGTYTATLFNTTNITSSTATVCQWIRVGNVVTVSGKVTVTPTTETGQTILGFSLPIASSIANDREVGGSAGGLNGTDAENATIVILGDATNDRAMFKFIAPVDNSPYDIYFSFTYLIL